MVFSDFAKYSGGAHGDHRHRFLARRYELHKAMAHHDGHLPDHAIAAHGPDEHPGERPGGTQMNHAALARRLLLPGYRQRTRTIVAWIRARERHTLRLQLEGRAGGVHLGYPFTRTLGGIVRVFVAARLTTCVSVCGR